MSTTLDETKIGGKKIESWTIEDHNRALNDLGAHIYKPFDGAVVEGAGSGPCMLKIRISTPGGEEIVEVVDALACYSAVPFGHKDPVVVEGVREFVSRMATIPRSISHTYLGPWLVALQEYTGMEMFLPKNGGTEANEAAIKAIRKWAYRYGGKNGDGIKDGNIPVIISARKSFHGRGFGSTTLMDDALSRKDVGPLIPGIFHVPFNDVDALRDMMRQHQGNVAAVFIEPIQAEAGVFVPDDNYLHDVQRLVKDNNALLVLDEIQTGYGRTGKDFAWQLYGIEKPDLMTIGKAMSAGILPISCLCGRRDILELFEPHSEGSTFGGYPFASYVGLLTICEYQNRDLTRKAAESGEYLTGKLRDVGARYPEIVKEVRGKGLLIGVELHPQYDGHELSSNMLANGVYAKETHGTNLRISPPLVIGKPEMDKIAGALDESLGSMRK
jgi:ornithine--oxo-acid transaminase